jgi:TRAP-type C4-dicarboxylate transport system permease small subunit
MTNASAEERPSNLIDRLGERLTQLCLAIAGISLLAIVAINGANVVARYAFRAPFPWAEELMLFLMILAVFAAAIAVTWRNLHVRIDTFIERASPQMRQAALIAGTLVAIVGIVTVAVASFRVVMLLYELEQHSDALGAPSWIPQSFLTIGLGMIALLMAVRLVRGVWFREFR